MADDRDNKYDMIIERVFNEKYVEGEKSVSFSREDLLHAAKDLHITPPKNPGDILYTFRYRRNLPESIRSKATDGQEWVLRSTGRSQHVLMLGQIFNAMPNNALVETKIPDATPGMVDIYCFNDEQALLAKLRYNRLIDIFSGVTCYSLQSHLRTTVRKIGQVETDELYVGVDRKGRHYVFPVQAKGKNDRIGIVQIEQDFALCKQKFPNLICRCIAAQFMEIDVIALFEFEMNASGIRIALEKHYRLVSPDNINIEDLKMYHVRLPSEE